MVGVTFAAPSVLVVISLSLRIRLLIQRHRIEVITLAIAALDTVGLNYLLKQDTVTPVSMQRSQLNANNLTPQQCGNSCLALIPGCTNRQS